MSKGKTRVAVDIGGTFTDVVLERSDGCRFTSKQLTTPADPGLAVLEAIAAVIESAAVDPQDVNLIVHGTTLATNALIERRGAKTALLTTAGHRDVLEMAHEDRFEQYDFNIDRPAPLVPRWLRLGITERMSAKGEPLIALDESSVSDAVSVLEGSGVESVAIGYLHAYANPAHETRTAEILREALPDISITLASEVCPEIREYERLSTACANAYIKPVVARYMNRLADELVSRNFTCPFVLMTSGGGLTTLDTATQFPIRLVESGPAGGAILARQVAEDLGLDQLLSFDMGGTTAKLCYIDNYEPQRSRSFEIDRVYRFKKGSGLPVRIPVIEMVEIGAGGGSVASIDKLKRLKIGPESAGSEPGPAAYSRGGTEATVTDADVLLGRIVPERFAGGKLQLDADAAAQAINRSVSTPMNLDQDNAAYGITEIVDENMASAARAHAAEFGLDLNKRAMIAFGGAAPLHAARLGEKLGVTQIVIPSDAGVGSAIGFLLAPVSYEVVRSRHQYLSDLDFDAINQLMTDMQQEAGDVVRKSAVDQDLVETRQAYMRYVGQGHEIIVDLPAVWYDETHSGEFRQRFAAAYTKVYGQLIDGIDIEVLSWTLTIAADATHGDAHPGPVPEQIAGPESLLTQSYYDAIEKKRLDVPVYNRSALSPGSTIGGPALITEDQTTTVVSSRFDARIDERMNIVLTRQPTTP